MPAFEVEEVNGQLVLLPTDGASGARKNPFAKVSIKLLVSSSGRVSFPCLLQQSVLMEFETMLIFVEES